MLTAHIAPPLGSSHTAHSDGYRSPWWQEALGEAGNSDSRPFPQGPEGWVQKEKQLIPGKWQMLENLTFLGPKTSRSGSWLSLLKKEIPFHSMTYLAFPYCPYWALGNYTEVCHSHVFPSRSLHILPGHNLIWDAMWAQYHYHCSPNPMHHVLWSVKFFQFISSFNFAMTL